MQKTTIHSIIAIVLLAMTGLLAKEYTYVGAIKCKKCHKAPEQGNQYQAWLDSRHNKSYAVLSSRSAFEEAEKANLKKPPNKSPQCLKCHSPLYEKAPDLVNQGVTCEVCHGPGSDYVKLNIMKSTEKSAQNGLIVYASQDAIKEKCLSCHTGEHFHFTAAWEEIKHPVAPKH